MLFYFVSKLSSVFVFHCSILGLWFLERLMMGQTHALCISTVPVSEFKLGFTITGQGGGGQIKSL